MTQEKQERSHEQGRPAGRRSVARDMIEAGYAAMEYERDRAWAALKKYGAHTDECRRAHDGGGECDCGLAGLLSLGPAPISEVEPAAWMGEGQVASRALRTLLAVRAWQDRAEVHPLTCGVDSRHAPLLPALAPDEQVVLVCPTCGYMQTFVPDAVRGGAS